jgi:glycosyltransferase involved in cell wall biosynthesis
MTALPKVSVVTINLNMAYAVAATLDSILMQTYPNLETVVIDGGSTDGSREIIAAYGPRLSHWVSEPDRSLYDGMNKGVHAATGDWVIFMNAGDRFAGPEALSCAFSKPHGDADVLYGHHIRRYVEQGIDRLIRAEPPRVLPLRMHCSHQALLMRRSILVERPFDLTILIADYESILAAYVGGKRFKPVDCVMAITVQGGQSDRHRVRVLRERAMIVRRNGLMTPAAALHYRWLTARMMTAVFLKAVLPKKLVTVILRHRPIGGMG